MHDRAHRQWRLHVYVAVEPPRRWALQTSLHAISVAGAPFLTSLQRKTLLCLPNFLMTNLCDVV